MQESIFAGTKLAKGFKTDPDAEQNGVWRIHPEFGIHARIRRATLPEHKRAIRKHFKPFQHLTRLDPKDDLLVRQKAAAEVLVADWGQTEVDDDGAAVLDGLGEQVRAKLVDARGDEIRASQENILAAFVEMPDFFQWVSDEADTFENYRAAVVESAGKNSRTGLLGIENGERPNASPSSNAEPSADSSTALSPVDHS